MRVFPASADEALGRTPQRRRVAVELLVLGVLSSGFLVLFPRRPIFVDLGLALFALGLVLLNANYTRAQFLGTVAGRSRTPRLAALRLGHNDDHGSRDSRIFLGRRRDRLSRSRLAWSEGKDSPSIHPHRRPVVLALGIPSANPLSVLPAWPDAHALPVAPSTCSVRVEWADLRSGSHHGHLDRSAGGAGRDPVEFFVSSLPPALASGRFTCVRGHNVLLLGVRLRFGEPLERLPQKRVELDERTCQLAHDRNQQKHAKITKDSRYIFCFPHRRALQQRLHTHSSPLR